MNQLQLLHTFSERLPSIWESVTETVKSTFPHDVVFEAPLAMGATPQDLSSELGGNMLLSRM